MRGPAGVHSLVTYLFTYQALLPHILSASLTGGVGVLDATWASGIRGIGYCPWLPALSHFHPCFLLMTLSFPPPQVRAQPTSLQKRWPPATSGPWHLLLPVLGHWQGSSRDLRWPPLRALVLPSLGLPPSCLTLSFLVYSVAPCAVGTPRVGWDGSVGKASSQQV